MVSSPLSSTEPLAFQHLSLASDTRREIICNLDSINTPDHHAFQKSPSKPPPSTRRPRVVSLSSPLDATHPTHHKGKHKPHSQIRPSSSFPNFQLCPPASFSVHVHIHHLQEFSGPLELRRMLQDTFEALLLGARPKLLSDGMGGAYVIHNKHHAPVAVFKPADEEPMAPNNPRGLAAPLGSSSIKAGVLSGEAASREVAAYLLDHQSLAGVPPTVLVTLPSHHTTTTTPPSHTTHTHNNNNNPLTLVHALSFDSLSNTSSFYSRHYQNNLNSNSNHNHYNNSYNNTSCTQTTLPCLALPSHSSSLSGISSHCFSSLQQQQQQQQQQQRRVEDGSGGIFEGVSSDAAVSPSSLPLQTGSLQLFVRSRCQAGDMGTSLFPISHVQHIALLDMRLINMDRHDGNILVQESLGASGEYERCLVPIDHGFCLPDHLRVMDFEWAWLSWPQVKEQMHPSLRQYILDLKPEIDADLLLRVLNIREQCVFMFLIVSHFIKTTCLLCPHVTLFDIATCMCRQDDSIPSLLESFVSRARWHAAITMVIRHQYHFVPPKSAISNTNNINNTNATNDNYNNSSHHRHHFKSTTNANTTASNITNNTNANTKHNSTHDDSCHLSSGFSSSEGESSSDHVVDSPQRQVLIRLYNALYRETFWKRLDAIIAKWCIQNKQQGWR